MMSRPLRLADDAFKHRTQVLAKDTGQSAQKFMCKP